MCVPHAEQTDLAQMVAVATSFPQIFCFKSDATRRDATRRDAMRCDAMRCDATRMKEFPGEMVAKATVVLLVASMQPCTKVTKLAGKLAGTLAGKLAGKHTRS